jgi:Carboxypeptidase regulatory-like domain
MSNREIVFCASIAALMTTALAGTTVAGTTGTLRGVVTDQRHAPVTGATVVVTSPAQREQTETDAAGRFVFISLAPATYAVTIVGRQFGTTSIQNVAVNADATTSVVARISRLFWTIDGLRVRPKESLIQPGSVADGYVIPSYWPLYDFNGTDIYALHFVPGLTYGTAPELSR